MSCLVSCAQVLRSPVHMFSRDLPASYVLSVYMAPSGVRHIAHAVPESCCAQKAQVQKCSRAGVLRCHAGCLMAQQCSMLWGKQPGLLLCWPRCGGH